MKKVLLVLTCIFFVNTSFGPVNAMTEDRPLTKENVWNVINELDIKFPEIVFAQAMLESGELKSKLTRKNNNIFGMKVPKKRATTALNKNQESYARYEHWMHSIEDYKLYQEYILGRRSLNTVTAYVAFLNRSYAEIGDYDKRIGRVVREHRSLLESYK